MRHALVGLFVALLALWPLSGCTPAWVTAGALAQSADAALGAYQRHTHAARAAILRTSRCASLAECSDALQAFDRAQLPALACLEAAAPLVEAAALAAKARDARAAAAAIPALSVQLPACVAAIQAVQ